MKKRAFITGVAGQDGSYLSEILLFKGYEVFGLVRKDSDTKYISKEVKILFGDLSDLDSIKKALHEAKPDCVYNLGGITELKTAFENPELTKKVNYDAVGVLLDEALKINPEVRFLQASSSLVFLPSSKLVSENSPKDTQSDNPYTKAKLSSDADFVQTFRKEKNAFACSAYLFNHESPRRPDTSVLRKIARTFAKMKLGQAEVLSVGNIDHQRDWGFAREYAEAISMILENDMPEDFIIAMGKLHSVRDAITIASEAVDISLKWQGEGKDTFATDANGKKRVEIDPAFYRDAEQYPTAGDISKAKKMLGWEPKVSFKELIELMVKAELSELS